MIWSKLWLLDVLKYFNEVDKSEYIVNQSYFISVASIYFISVTYLECLFED